MAWSVSIWKIFGFRKVSLYLKRLVPKHATAHIRETLAPIITDDNTMKYAKGI